MELTLTSTIIDKTVPIFILGMKNNEVSQYYEKLCIDNFTKFGYNNLTHFEAIVPETMGDELTFASHRYYNLTRRRDWDIVEQAIWYSHYYLWCKCAELDETIIVAEHDCMMTKPFTEFVLDHGLFSFAATTRTSHSIAGVGYIITPKYARRLMRFAEKAEIKHPCDGFIHSFQSKRMPYGEFDNKFLHKQVFARHFVDPKVGTVKATRGKKRK
jgi:GR25 family glycosyltransferase involved in LPS biosynthesis